MNISWFNAFFPQEPGGPSLAMTTVFHFATLVHVLQPLHFLMMQQFFRAMHSTTRVFGGGMMY
jgi:hypothetical protein